jgi:hypothetical protein
MKGWTLDRPIDVGLESIDNGFLALPNRVRCKTKSAASWIEGGLYLEEYLGGKGTWWQGREYRKIKIELAWMQLSMGFLALSDRVR